MPTFMLVSPYALLPATHIVLLRLIFKCNLVGILDRPFLGIGVFN